MRTKHILLTLGAASALAIGSSASAAVTVDDTSFAKIDGPTDLDGTITIGFAEAGLATPTFSEYLTFTNTMAGEYFLTLSTSSPNIDILSAILTGSGGPYSLNPVITSSTEFFNLENLFLDAGEYTLAVDGVNRGTGVFSGNITIAQTQAAVPEPGTWAMMLFGFGAIGFAMRRRRDTQGAKRIRLAYS